MRIVKLSLMSLVVLGMTACTTVRNHGFLKDETQSYKNEQPIPNTVVIPQNLSSKNMQDYYEVPQPSAQAANISPTLIPPGSNIPQRPVVISQQDRIRNAESAKIQGHTAAQSVAPAAVSASFAQAWVKVGHVLQASNYKIVERDKALGTYYVIDTRSSGGKVKKDMPIYQVHLKATGNGTVVSVSPANGQLQGQLNRSLQ